MKSIYSFIINKWENLVFDISYVFFRKQNPGLTTYNSLFSLGRQHE